MTSVERATAIDRVVDVTLDAAPEIRALQVERRGTSTNRANPSGDDVIAADLAADDLLVDRLVGIEGVGTVASEEREEAVDAGEGLAVAIDPLDGSSNLAPNAPTGTIVGVYDATELPARGRSIVATVLVCYGPVTTAHVAIEGEGVVEYELALTPDGPVPNVSEESVDVPAEPRIYGVGGGDDDWPEPVAELVGEFRKDLKLRYGGALVADLAQVLQKGGVFAYPQLESRPDGKLRYQFEVGPVAFLVEEAGGASTDGAGSLLDRPVDGLHDRAPIYVGSPETIERVERIVEDEA